MKIILKGEEAKKRYFELKQIGYILFECVVGSQAYGTALPTSDIDKKFIYCETLENILSNTASSQIILNDDYVGFELSEFFDLLAKQSPNMHELMWTPEDCIIDCKPLFEKIILSERENFLSKKIRFSFAEYAEQQIKKAKGLNKKIVNPMGKERKTPLDFCWIAFQDRQGSMNLVEWLDLNDLKQEYCGLSAIDHMKYYFHLFYDFPAHTKDIPFEKLDIPTNRIYNFCSLADKVGILSMIHTRYEDYYKKLSDIVNFNYKGIIKKDISNEVAVSSIVKNSIPLTIIFFNQEGYTKYCKDYKDYWHWVDNRNEARYNTNLSHGAEYDSKNMMHCHRLLDTCLEALRDKKVNVRRNNREQLLEIRYGKYPYEQLLKDAEEKINTIKAIYETTNLRENVEEEYYTELLRTFRFHFLFLQ